MTKLSMIAHGTDGRDGIEAGVHLRWQFDPKLGFPPSGFYLFRRPTCSIKPICLDFDKIYESTIKLPYDHYIEGEADRTYKIPLTSSSEGKVNLIKKKLEEESVRLLNIKKSIEFHLPDNAQQVHISAYSKPQGYAEITAKVGDLEVEKQSTLVEGLQTIVLSAPNVDSISVSGKNIMISKICFHVCEECEKEWEGPINGKCGFGLPVNVTFGENSKPVLTHLTHHVGVPTHGWTVPRIDEERDPEWSVAACRIPKDKWYQYREPFDDLRNILRIMVERAKEAPMGWKKLSYKSKTMQLETGEPSPELRISTMDLILLASVDPYIARMLGLYWVDTYAKDGEVYDYKIVGYWPKGTLWNLKRCADFEREDVGKIFFNIFNKEDFVFINSGLSIVQDIPSSFAQTGRGLYLSSPKGLIIIYCTQPVREIQLFIQHQGQSVTVEAFHDNSLVDSATLVKPEGVLAVHHQENIDFINIRAKDIVIYKICTDSEYIPHGEYSFTLCGIKKEVPQPLPIPTGLKAYSLPGMTRTQKDGSVVDLRFCAGLRWDLPLGTGGKLYANAPILYHVQRKAPWGEIKWLTEKSPVMIVPESVKNPQRPQGWPAERMFYVDAVPNQGIYQYRIVAMDIFGRMSKYTGWVQVELKPTVSPPPADVEAKFLDRDDPMLSGDERAWVTANKKTGLKVRWKWTENLRRQAPDVRAFKIHFQPEWLNVVQGKIDDTPVESGGMLELKSDYTNAVIPENVFANEKLQMNQVNYNIESSKRDSNGKFIFSIKKPIPKGNDFATCYAGTFSITNIAEIGNNLEITIEYNLPAQLPIEDFIGKTVEINQKTYEITSCKKDSTGTYPTFTVAKIYPSKGDFFSIPISKRNEPPAGAFIDYRKPSNWKQELHTETVILPSKEQYEVIIHNPPLHPDQNNMVVYGQIGIGSINSEGEGSVSTPATVIAVYRERPPTQEIKDKEGEYASPANYHGKSSFALRWNKNPAVRYFVYRAMDETLFAVDAEVRSISKLNDSQADTLITDLGLENYADKIKEKITSPNTIGYSDLLKETHKNVLLKVLANLPGNEKAFAKLHEKVIHPDDPKYSNKLNFWESDSLIIDTNALMYMDDTLDGRANNLYFYRIRTANEIGTLGDFGPSTFPVYLPKVTPPIVPKITIIEGGDRKITIKWSPNLEPGIAGYLVYRTDSERFAQDVRRMMLLKNNPADNYSVNVIPEPLFIDQGVEGRKRYFYRVVAVAVINENGKQFENRSDPSIVVTGQAYQPPPDPPTMPLIGGLVWDTTHEKVTLTWTHSDPKLESLVERRAEGGLMWIAVTSWIEQSIYTHTDEPPDPSIKYEYRIKVRDTLGQANTTYKPQTTP